MKLSACRVLQRWRHSGLLDTLDQLGLEGSLKWPNDVLFIGEEGRRGSGGS